MKKYNVAILGATGAVGQEMLKVLEEYDIPCGEASAAGKREERGRHGVLQGGGRENRRGARGQLRGDGLLCWAR